MDTAVDHGFKLHFASDYMEGAHRFVMDAINWTNFLSTPGYGDDEYTKKAEREILEECGCPDGEVKFVIGGTQANAVVIDAVLKSYQGVIAPDTGHVSLHEAGAIELGGHKVLQIPSHDGKISAEQISQFLADHYADANHEHMVMPGMVYISQPTEYGTLYTLDELTQISRVCRESKLPLYVDGARLAYALAAPENDVTLKDLAALTDIFYIGGTKCGALFGEAIVLPKRGYIPHFFSIIKQHGALLAKGRLLGVQFDALFSDGLYKRIGENAIIQAQRIREELAACGYKLYFDSPTNQVFFVIDNKSLEYLDDYVEYGFWEKYDDTHSVIRFATSWFTPEKSTDRLLELIRKLRDNRQDI